jgi:hypothetical protein
MSIVRSVTLNDVAVDTMNGQTHIVIYHENKANSTDNSADLSSLGEMKMQMVRLIDEVSRLSQKVSQMEKKSTPFFNAEVAPAPFGLDVWRMSDMTEALPCEPEEAVIPAKSMLQVLINKLPATAEAEAEEAEEAAEEEAEEEAEAEAEEAEEEQEEEAEEEDEALELEEFEFKGVTYYKDPEGQVYQKDDDGDLDDTPIGIWNEAKQKIQKYAKA